MDEPDHTTPPPLPDPGVSAAPPPLPDAPPPLPADLSDDQNTGDGAEPPDEDAEVHDDLVDDAAAAEAITQRALLHATERTRTYPCGQCGGELVFGILEQKL